MNKLLEPQEESILQSLASKAKQPGSENRFNSNQDIAIYWVSKSMQHLKDLIALIDQKTSDIQDPLDNGSLAKILLINAQSRKGSSRLNKGLKELSVRPGMERFVADPDDDLRTKIIQLHGSD